MLATRSRRCGEKWGGSWVKVKKLVRQLGKVVGLKILSNQQSNLKNYFVFFRRIFLSSLSESWVPPKQTPEAFPSVE